MIKSFLGEPGIDDVVAAVDGADVRATSRLSYVECGAAFARADREGRVPKGEAARFARTFEQAWQDLAVVELDAQISGHAVGLARAHPRRAADAIHLASALAIAPSVGAVAFACFDRRLWEAARTLGLDRIPASPPR